MTEHATCRHCGKVLIGKNYCFGGAAHIPNAQGGLGARAPINYYGGYVCSRSCDYRASLSLEESMPGHAGQRNLNGPAMERVNSNWGEQ